MVLPSRALSWLASPLLVSFLPSAESFCLIPSNTDSSLVGKKSSSFRLHVMSEDDPVMIEFPNKNKSLKAIIFDIDGTLADSWKLGFDATLVVLEQNNVPTISSEEYHAFTRYATPDRLARHAGYEPGHAEYERVGNRLGAEFDNLYVGLVSTETAGYYNGIEELLQDIPSSIALGALTNACVDYAHAVFRSNSVVAAGDEEEKDGQTTKNWSKRFASVRGADNVPKPKPHPDGLLEVCKDLLVDPRDCVYVGDSPSDAMAAHAAGMPSIGVLWGSHSKESLEAAPFSVLCQTVDELRSALNLVLVK